MRKSAPSRNLACIAVVFLVLFVMACFCGRDNENRKSQFSSSSAPTKLYTSDSTYSTNSNSFSNNNSAASDNQNSKKLSTEKSAVVISENANLRKSASSNSEVVETVARDVNVEVVKQRGVWFFVKTENQSGWLHGNTIRLNGTVNIEAKTNKKSSDYYSAPSSTESVSSSGATAKCGDGTLSYSASRRGTCSHHGGVAVWY